MKKLLLALVVLVTAQSAFAAHHHIKFLRIIARQACEASNSACGTRAHRGNS